MRRLLTGYAIHFNLRHRRSGHLFQDRYKSIVCEEDPYLLELVRYIHLNPVRAGLVKDVGGLDRYPWSGHSVLLGKRVMQGQAVGRSSEVLEGGWVQGDGIIGDLLWKDFPRGEELSWLEVASAAAGS